MSADLQALVASPWWRWMPGMLATGPGWLGEARLVGVDGDGDPCLWMYREHVCTSSWVDPEARPAIDDPATIGCLLALARRAWGDPTITTHCWRVAPHVFARDPGRGPERWSAAGASVEEMILDPQVARDWRAAPGWNDVPREPHGALCPSFRGPTEADALIAAILAAPPPGVPNVG